MTTYLGDYVEDSTLDFMWSSNGADGASITRATNGTISVYKGNSVTQSTAGITDTEDFDSLTGIHHVRIDLAADAFYATGNDYMVVLSGATIDGKSVNAVLAHFSIQNRYMRGTNGANTTAPPSAAAVRAEMDANSTQLAAIVEDTGTTLPAQISGISGGGGAGAIEVVDILINDGSDPVAGAAVWLTTNSNGTNVVWNGVTDAFGYPKDGNGENPFLDAGTYYIWVQLSGYSFTNPTSKVVA